MRTMLAGRCCAIAGAAPSAPSSTSSSVRTSDTPRMVSLAPSARHGDGDARRRTIAGWIRTRDRDRVDAAASGSRSLGTEVQRERPRDLPVGGRISIAQPILGLVAGDVDNAAGHEVAALVLGGHADGHRHYLVVV